MESKAIFEAAQVGDFKLLKDLYIGSINQVNKEQLNRLSVVIRIEMVEQHYIIFFNLKQIGDRM